MKKIVFVIIGILVSYLSGCVENSAESDEDYQYVNYEITEVKYETVHGVWDNSNLTEMIDYYYYNEIEKVDIDITMKFYAYDKFTIAELKGKMGITNVSSKGFSYQNVSANLNPKVEGYEMGDHEIKLKAKDICFYDEYNRYKKIERKNVKLILELNLRKYNLK